MALTRRTDRRTGDGRIATLRPRTLITAALGGLALAPAGAAAGADTTPPPVPTGPRLVGTFLMASRVIVAEGIPGERRGATVTRGWGFTPNCPTGSCATVKLVRQRAGGYDLIILRRTASPTRYTGIGTFTVPVACDGRTVAPGERVRYRVTVQMTQAAPAPDGPVATRINARVVGLRRENLSRCVARPGRERILLHGHLLTAAVPG